MNFNNKNELERFLKRLTYIGIGSQGSCYLNKQDNMVIKMFHDYEDNNLEKSEHDIMKFSNITNKTFIWPTSIISLQGKTIGYKLPYVKGTNLYAIDPLKVNLTKLENFIQKAREDIKIISKHHVLTYDVSYNVMLGDRIYIIDHEEYVYRTWDSPENLNKKNNANLDYEIYNFLVDGYFNTIVNDHKILSELYYYKDEDVLEFLKIFKAQLCTLVDKDINYLSEANELLDTHPTTYYQRNINNPIKVLSKK